MEKLSRPQSAELFESQLTPEQLLRQQGRVDVDVETEITSAVVSTNVPLILSFPFSVTEPGPPSRIRMFVQLRR